MGIRGPVLLVSYDYFAHSGIFHVISHICVYFTKSGSSCTTRA